MLKRSLLVFVAIVAPALLPAQAPAPDRSAPLTNIRYEVTFDAARARARALHVVMTFDVGADAPVLLSLPIWTPGAYEVSDFAQNVSAFAANGSDGRSLRWDKLDFDTWRVVPAGVKTASVSFDYRADSLDNAMAWSKPDFLLFNGTNVFLYPEGRGFDFAATVSIKTESGWLVATGMHSAGAANTFRESNYHDLVDMPFFVGKFDIDSSRIGDRWTRLVTYPAGMLSGGTRTQFQQQLGQMIPPEIAVFQDTPWDNYSVMVIFDSSYGGGSALEHQSSHVGIYTPLAVNAVAMGNPFLASITAHEIFHAWNVKRLRPADLWPYQYDRPEPTPWLWVSEGITDYYADLALLRGGIIESGQFFELTNDKVGEVASVPPIALEDASLSTWIHPKDGTATIYYPKGSLAGLLLDIQIRDASDTKRSLDDVLRELYRTAYKAGKGFTPSDWWNTVQSMAGGKTFTDFNDRYIDGRERFPWSSVLPLAGLRLQVDSSPRLGIQSAASGDGVIVAAVTPGGVAEAAGLQPGDLLISVGDIKVKDQSFGAEFRKQYAGRDGADLPVVVKRAGNEVRLSGKVRLAEDNPRIEMDDKASEKAIRVRNGILRGTTAR